MSCIENNMKEFIHYVPESRKHEGLDHLSLPELEVEIQKQEEIEKELEYILKELVFSGDEQELVDRLESLEQRKEELSCGDELASDDADMIRLDCEKIEDNIKYYTEIQTKRKELEETKKTLFNLRETMQKRIDNN